MEHVRPWKRLVGFARVGPLAPGESARVEIALDADTLAMHDDAMAWRVVPGVYNVSVGGSSYDAAFVSAPLTLL